MDPTMAWHRDETYTQWLARVNEGRVALPDSPEEIARLDAAWEQVRS